MLSLRSLKARGTAFSRGRTRQMACETVGSCRNETKSTLLVKIFNIDPSTYRYLLLVVSYEVSSILIFNVSYHVLYYIWMYSCMLFFFRGPILYECSHCLASTPKKILRYTGTRGKYHCGAREQAVHIDQPPRTYNSRSSLVI